MNSAMPVWKQPRGSFGSNYWTFYSFKLGRDVNFYSNLERDHGVLIEADSRIRWYCEQPLQIRIKVDGHDRETILDMLVRYEDGRDEYREVKYMSELAQREKCTRIMRQLTAQQRWAQVATTHYRIVTEQEIRQNRFFLTNWKRMIAHLAATAEESLETLEKQVMKAFEATAVWRLVELEQYCRPASPQLSRTAIYRLIHRGQLRAPLEESPLSKIIPIQRARP